MHRGLGTLEAAEDELVFAHEQRAEIAHGVGVLIEFGGALRDATSSATRAPSCTPGQKHSAMYSAIGGSFMPTQT